MYSPITCGLERAGQYSTVSMPYNKHGTLRILMSVEYNRAERVTLCVKLQ